MARGIKSLHPIIVFLYYLAMMIWIIIIDQPLFLITSLLVLLLLNVMLDSGNKLVSWWKVMAVMSLFILIATPLFNRRGEIVLFYLFNNPVVLESVVLGVQITLQFITLLLLVITLPYMLPTNHFIYLFARVSTQWSLLIMLGIRFIPALKNQINQMQEIQRQKSSQVTQASWLDKVKVRMQLLKMLLSNALEDAMHVADSMTARGYSYGDRTYYHDFHFQSQDLFSLVLLLLSNLILIFGNTWGYLTAQGLNFIGQAYQWFFLLGWLLLAGLPLFIEGKEWVKWQYLQSKM